MKNAAMLATLLLCVSQMPCAVSQNNSEGSSLGALGSSSLFGNTTQDKEFGKLPTNITSDTLSLNAKDRIFVYKGNVVVTQGNMTLTSKVVEGNYNDQNQIQKIVAKGDVVITKQDIKATSQLATYDAISSIVTLTDNPQLQQGESVLIADRIKVYLNEDRSQAEGNVRVTFVKTTPAPTPVPATPTPQPKPSMGTKGASDKKR
jgi:lipopolysaccharide export system protein LptA